MRYYFSLFFVCDICFYPDARCRCRHARYAFAGACCRACRRYARRCPTPQRRCCRCPLADIFADIISFFFDAMLTALLLLIFSLTLLAADLTFIRRRPDRCRLFACISERPTVRTRVRRAARQAQPR